MRRLALATLLALSAAAGPAHALDLEQLPGSYQQPVHVAGPPGDATRVFVVEKGGTIELVENGTPAATPFLDISARVDTDNEEGLLSMAFAADYATSGRYWIFYTQDVPGVPGSDLVVEERLRDVPGHEPDILRIAHHRSPNHNGGQIHVGPDGNLWVATGDGGGAFDTYGNAQVTTSLLGKVLRIAPRPGGGYEIPPGNPFVNGGGAPEVWSLGLRNPWRFSFDRGTGALLLGDVGQGVMEEVDHASAPGLGCAANYGWVPFEGTRPTGIGTLSSPHTPPLFTQTRDEGWRAIAGGYVIRDPALAEAGMYVYGDFFVDALWLYDFATGARTATDETVDMLAGFGEDGVGRVYAASLGGTVHRLESDAGTNGVAAPRATFVPPGCTLPPPPPGDPEDAQTTETIGTPAEDGQGATGTAAAPRIAAGTLRRQRALRRRRIFVRGGCDVACDLALTGRLAVGRARFRLAGERVLVPAGGRRVLVVRTGPRALRAGRRALRRGRSVRGLLALRATGPSGAVTRRRLTVRLVG
jgi:hypothetical protein